MSCRSLSPHSNGSAQPFLQMNSTHPPSPASPPPSLTSAAAAQSSLSVARAPLLARSSSSSLSKPALPQAITTKCSCASPSRGEVAPNARRGRGDGEPSGRRRQLPSANELPRASRSSLN
jgi:hypothetical protein